MCVDGIPEPASWGFLHQFLSQAAHNQQISLGGHSKNLVAFQQNSLHKCSHQAVKHLGYYRRYLIKHLHIPDWNLWTFSTRSCPCNKKNQACKWTSHAQ